MLIHVALLHNGSHLNIVYHFDFEMFLFHVCSTQAKESTLEMSANLQCQLAE